MSSPLSLQSLHEPLLAHILSFSGNKATVCKKFKNIFEESARKYGEYILKNHQTEDFMPRMRLNAQLIRRLDFRLENDTAYQFPDAGRWQALSDVLVDVRETRLSGNTTNVVAMSILLQFFPRLTHLSITINDYEIAEQRRQLQPLIQRKLTQLQATQLRGLRVELSLNAGDVVRLKRADFSRSPFVDMGVDIYSSDVTWQQQCISFLRELHYLRIDESAKSHYVEAALTRLTNGKCEIELNKLIGLVKHLKKLSDLVELGMGRRISPCAKSGIIVIPACVILIGAMLGGATVLTTAGLGPLALIPRYSGMLQTALVASGVGPIAPAYTESAAYLATYPVTYGGAYGVYKILQKTAGVAQRMWDGLKASTLFN